MGSTFTWIMLGLILAMVVIMLLNGSRQKKANAEAQKTLSELKPGDKVRTHIGVYGKIVSITETTDGKVCIIETGDKVKTQIELDMRAVAGVDTKQIAVYDKDNNLISLDGKPVEIPTANVEQKTNVEEKVEVASTKTTQPKKSTTAKKSTKKPTSKK